MPIKSRIHISETTSESDRELLAAGFDKLAIPVNQHSRFYTPGAATGRLSSSKSNLRLLPLDQLAEFASKADGSIPDIAFDKTHLPVVTAIHVVDGAASRSYFADPETLERWKHPAVRHEPAPLIGGPRTGGPGNDVGFADQYGLGLSTPDATGFAEAPTTGATTFKISGYPDQKSLNLSWWEAPCEGIPELNELAEKPERDSEWRGDL
jgi:hypothetical protein